MARQYVERAKDERGRQSLSHGEARDEKVSHQELVDRTDRDAQDARADGQREKTSRSLVGEGEGLQRAALVDEAQ